MLMTGLVQNVLVLLAITVGANLLLLRQPSNEKDVSISSLRIQCSRMIWFWI